MGSTNRSGHVHALPETIESRQDHEVTLIISLISVDDGEVNNAVVIAVLVSVGNAIAIGVVVVGISLEPDRVGGMGQHFLRIDH